MWRECEKLVRCHVANSPAHQQVLECLLHCKGPTPGPVSPSPSKAPTEEGSTKGGAGAKGEVSVKEEKPTGAASQFDQSMQTYERYILTVFEHSVGIIYKFRCCFQEWLILH